MDEPNENTLWSCCVTISVKYLVISDTFQNAQSMLMSFVVLLLWVFLWEGGGGVFTRVVNIIY